MAPPFWFPRCTWNYAGLRENMCELNERTNTLVSMVYRMFRELAGRVNGGREGDRTLDLGVANAALSHLSYSPKLNGSV